MSPRQRAYYQGIALAPYDLVKEGLIGLLLVGVLVVGLAATLSSPDEPPLTVQHVAATAPLTFLSTALGELNGTDSIDSYGPPYNGGSGSVPSLGLVSLQRLRRGWAYIPVNTAQDMVLGPLRHVAPDGSRRSPRALRDLDRATPARAGCLGGRLWRRAGQGARPGAAVQFPPAATVRSRRCWPVCSPSVVGAPRARRGQQPAHSIPPTIRGAFSSCIGGLPAQARALPSRRLAVGHDERDGQLSRAGLALALHVLVSGSGLCQLAERGCAGDGHDGRADAGVGAAALDSRASTGCRVSSASIA